MREADASPRSIACAWAIFVFGRPETPESEGDSMEVSGVPLDVGICVEPLGTAGRADELKTEEPVLA